MSEKVVVVRHVAEHRFSKSVGNEYCYETSLECFSLLCASSFSSITGTLRPSSQSALGILVRLSRTFLAG